MRRRRGMVPDIGLLRRLSAAAGSGRGRVAVWTGSWTGRLSRRLGIGERSIIGGRTTLAVDPAALRKLAAGRRVALVSGTNGKPRPAIYSPRRSARQAKWPTTRRA